MKPRASASFCHWPKLTSTPSGQVGAELRLEPGRQPLDHVVRSGPLDGRDHRGLVVEAGHIADAHGMARPELEPEEILKRAGEPRPPFVGAHAREVDAIHQDATAGRLVQPAQELHERGLAGAVLADDGDHRAGLQIQADIVEHAALRARIGEGHVLEADALRRAAPAPAHRRARPATRRSPRARPGAASRRARSRAGSRSRPPWRRCTPTAASPRPAPAAHCPGVACEPEETNTTAPTYAAPKIAHASVCHSALPQRAAATGPYQRSHASRRSATSRSPMPVTRTSLPGRRRGGRHRTGAAPAGWPARPLLGGALHARPPRGGEHRRQREHRQQRQRRVNRHQQRHRHAEPQDPAAGGEQRHVHVVEHEDLVAQHREPVEVFGAFVMLDRGHRRLQPGHVRFERDRSRGRETGAGCGR